MTAQKESGSKHTSTSTPQSREIENETAGRYFFEEKSMQREGSFSYENIDQKKAGGSNEDAPVMFYDNYVWHKGRRKIRKFRKYVENKFQDPSTVRFTIGMLSLLFGLAFMLSAIGVYLKKNKVMTKRVINANESFHKYFYFIDAEHFHDTNGNGYGDFKGISQNLQNIVDLGVSSVVLKNVWIDIANENRQLSDLQNLVKEIKNLGMNVYFDITRNFFDGNLNKFGKFLVDFPGVDGVFFNYIQLNKEDNKTTSHTIEYLNRVLSKTKKEWYVALPKLWYKDMDEWFEMETKFSNTSVTGFIWTINTPHALLSKPIHEIFSFYKFLVELSTNVQNKTSKEHIYHVETTERTQIDGGLYLYPYLYSALGFGNAKLMLDAGQELKEGKITQGKYSEKASSSVTKEESYIEYFKALSQMRRSEKLFSEPGHPVFCSIRGLTLTYTRMSSKGRSGVTAIVNAGKKMTNLKVEKQFLNRKPNVKILHHFPNPLSVNQSDSSMLPLSIHYVAF